MSAALETGIVRSRIAEFCKRLWARHRGARSQPPRASDLILGMVTIILVVGALARFVAQLLSAG